MPPASQNELRIWQDEGKRLEHDLKGLDHRVKENKEKIKLNNQLPYLVGNIVEILDMDPEEDEDGGAIDLDAQRKGKAVVLKTSTRQTVFLPVVGLVDPKASG